MLQRPSPMVALRSDRIVPYLPLLLPIFLFFYTLNTFPYPSAEAIYSDLTLAHYPNAIYLRRAILEEGRIPLWSEGILGGAPFAANPLSGLWYPPGWLALLLPLPLGFNLLVALHLAWGGLGMYLLLKAENLSHPAGLLGALAFTWLPKLFAHYGAGHLTLLYAVPWTPWLLWAGLRRGANICSSLNHTSLAGMVSRRDVCRPLSHGTQGPEASRWPYWEGLFLALIFLADVRWSVYAGVLWLAYGLAHRQSPLVRRAAGMLGQVTLAALLAAPLALPLLEFTRLSTRANLGEEDVLAFSLPPIRLLGLFFPDYGGFHEYMLYAGQAILALSILAVVCVVRKGAWFWLWTALAALVFSLGAYLPPVALLVRLPLLDWLRVPARANFITGICMAVLAAQAIDWLVGMPGRERSLPPVRNAQREDDGSQERERRRAGLVLMALVSFSLAMTASVTLLTHSLTPNFAWGTAFCLASAGWIGLRVGGRLSPRPWLVGLGVLVLLDLGSIDFSVFAPRPAGIVLAEGQELAEYLANAPGLFRVYSPSYSLPQQTAAVHDFQLADGVDPLQLQSFVTFMQKATGVPWSGYSVTLPPFATGQPSLDNAAYRPAPSLLGLLNVRYIASEFDLDVGGLSLLRRFGETRLYENSFVRPRAWVYPQNERVQSPLGQVEFLEWSPESIEMVASGPGLLVLSEVAYPGWLAKVDGMPTPMATVHNLLRGIHLDEGERHVMVVFRPLSLYLGLGLWSGAMLYLILSTYLQRKCQESLPPSGESF